MLREGTVCGRMGREGGWTSRRDGQGSPGGQIFARAARWCVMLLCLIALPGGSPTSAAAARPALITEGEAMLRDAPTLKGLDADVSTGPRITVVSPQDGKTYAAPVEIDVVFEPAPGAPAVRSDTLRVVYVKLWEIDITERFLPYLRDNRVHIPHAHVPAGRHVIRLSIADQAGQTSTRTMRVNVQ
jgi:hypothetical protein